MPLHRAAHIQQSYSLNIKYYPSIYRISKHFNGMFWLGEWFILSVWVCIISYRFPLIVCVVLKYDRKNEENVPHLSKQHKIIIFKKSVDLYRFLFCRAKVVFVIWGSKEGWFYLPTLSRQFLLYEKWWKNVILYHFTSYW